MLSSIVYSDVYRSILTYISHMLLSINTFLIHYQLMGRKNDADNGSRKRKKDKAKNRPVYSSRHVREIEKRMEMAEERNTNAK